MLGLGPISGIPISADTLSAPGTPAALPQPRPTPVTARQMLLAASTLTETEQAEIVNHQVICKLRRRFNPLGPSPGAGVSKMVQYDVLLPPDNAVNIGKFVQYDVLLPPDNAVDVGKFVQYVALVPPDNAVMVAKAIQFVVLETPPPIARPLLWNTALVLSDLSGDIAPAPILRKQNGMFPATPVTWLPEISPLYEWSTSWIDPEQPLAALWPLWRKPVSLDAVQSLNQPSDWRKCLLMIAAAEQDPPSACAPLFGNRTASFDTWALYPLPAPSAALIQAWIANNLPDDDPPWALWTRGVLAPGTYNQRQFPVRPMFWRMGTALTFPEPRVDLRRFVQKGRPPFNEYDPVIIVN